MVSRDRDPKIQRHHSRRKSSDSEDGDRRRRGRSKRYVSRSRGSSSSDNQIGEDSREKERVGDDEVRQRDSRVSKVGGRDDKKMHRKELIKNSNEDRDLERERGLEDGEINDNGIGGGEGEDSRVLESVGVDEEKRHDYRGSRRERDPRDERHRDHRGQIESERVEHGRRNGEMGDRNDLREQKKKERMQDGGNAKGKERDSRISPDSWDDKRRHRKESHKNSYSSDEDGGRKRNEDREKEQSEEGSHRRRHKEERSDRLSERKMGHNDDRRRRHRHERSDESDYDDSKEDDKSLERERRKRAYERRHKDGESLYHKEEKTREEHWKDNRHAQQKPTEESKKEEVKIDNTNTGRSGGIYIPPFKLARMMKEVQDKSSVEYQRLTWDALRKSINGLVNKVNATNIKNIIPELFAENLIRGRGLFCRSCMKSQMASPGFTDVFAALASVVNTKFPEVGNLLLRRIVLQLKRAYKRNDKHQLLAATKFIAHLVNQQVAHEIIALELLTVLLENPTDDSVEVAVGFVKECGSLLQDLSPQGLHGIFERFRGILHEGEIDRRVQFLIEGLFAIRKAKFQGYPAVRPELDLVEQEDQFTHELSLEDEIDQEINLDIFKPDPQFLEHEKAYENLKKDILGDDESSEEEEGSGAASDDEDDEESDDEEEENMKIKDETETNLVNLRRTIYLTIMSSVDFEEAGHKLLKIKLEPGQEMELCIMLLECCSQERTYLRYYGLLGQRFCMINRVHQENFEKCFVQQYSMIHRLETNKLRNVAKFFAHLLGTDALPWHVLAYIRLTEEDTTSSSRIFIKILFQELSEHLGIRLLNERLNDPGMQDSFESIFPKDNPKNTRFAINFFTSIGLGGITESLREYLKNMPRLIMQQQKPVSESEDESGSSSSSGSDDASSSESESESSSDESEDRRRCKRRKRD